MVVTVVLAVAIAQPQRMPSCKVEFGDYLRTLLCPFPFPPAMPASNPPLDLIIAKAESLYSLPAVAMEVLKLTEGERVDARALKECIERDPALVVKLLRVVNSSLFGLSSKVENLTQALALLGIKPLKLLVLGFSLPNKLLDEVDADQLKLYWRAALVRAVAARQLVETQWNSAGDDAFLVALLQDIGKLVLLAQLGSPYAHFLQHVTEEHEDLIELEHRSLGFDHRQLTVALLRKWRLPEMYAAAVSTIPTRRNTADSYSLETSLPQVLALANLFAELVDQHRLAVLPELLERGEQYGALTHDDVCRLVAELQPQVDQLAAVLDIDLGERPTYTDVLLESQARLARLGENIAGRLMPSEQQLCDELLADTQDLQRAMLAFGHARPSNLSEELRADAAAPAVPTPRTQRSAVAFPMQRQLVRDAVEAAVAECRHERCPLSLICFEVTCDLPREPLIDVGDLVSATMQQVMMEFDLSTEQLLRTSPTGASWILPNTERREAVELANRVATLIDERGGRESLALKAGVSAVHAISRSFAAADLQAAAERCLEAACSAGGRAVKSIEVY